MSNQPFISLNTIFISSNYFWITYNEKKAYFPFLGDDPPPLKDILKSKIYVSI
jgi:hypothetical protein